MATLVYTARTQAQLLEVIRKLLPRDYFAPIESAREGGYELFQAFAQVGVRVSTAVNRLEEGAFLIYAKGAERASAEVAFSRPTAAAGAVDIKAGTIVTTDDGRDFELLADVSFGAPDVGPILATVRAVGYGFEWNVPGPLTAANGEVVPGAINRIKLPLLDPVYGDTTFAVEQTADATGGHPGYLDGLVSNRGLQRQAGESDDALRARARALPNVVTPNAIQEAIDDLLTPLGIPFNFIEVFEHRYQEVYDAPSPNSGTPTYDGGSPPTNPDYSDTTFVYDDPRTPTVSSFINRVMDRNEYRATFVVVVPKTVVGVSAALLGARYAALRELLDEIKPAGVTAVIDTPQ